MPDVRAGWDEQDDTGNAEQTRTDGAGRGKVPWIHRCWTCHRDRLASDDARWVKSGTCAVLRRLDYLGGF